MVLNHPQKTTNEQCEQWSKNKESRASKENYFSFLITIIIITSSYYLLLKLLPHFAFYNSDEDCQSLLQIFSTESLHTLRRIFSYPKCGKSLYLHLFSA